MSKTLAQIKKTAWHKNLVSQFGDRGEGYQLCMKHAMTPGLEVTIYESGDHLDNGKTEHVVDVVSDPGNWLAGFKKRESAERLCKQMGWTVK